MCIRQGNPGSLGDLLLESTTEDEVGERLEPQAIVLKGRDGKFYLDVMSPIVLRHKAEEDVPVPVGLYRIGSDLNWGGAPLNGLCTDG